MDSEYARMRYEETHRFQIAMKEIFWTVIAAGMLWGALFIINALGHAIWGCR